MIEALQEIPEQYKIIKNKLKLLDNNKRQTKKYNVKIHYDLCPVYPEATAPPILPY